MNHARCNELQRNNLLPGQDLHQPLGETAPFSPCLWLPGCGRIGGKIEVGRGSAPERAEVRRKAMTPQEGLRMQIEGYRRMTPQQRLQTKECAP
jgi:hypothetical protein